MSNQHTARNLCLVGSILVIVGAIVNLVSNQDVASIVINIIFILISILILASINVLNLRNVIIDFEWWLIFIFVLVEAILMRSIDIFSADGLGLLLEIVALGLLMTDEFG